MVIVESATAEKRTPTITIKSKKGEEKRYLLPTGAHVMVQNGNEVYPGDILARIPRATTKTKDITGGLPRVVELFEARHPRDKAVISEVEGTVHHGPVVKGMRRVIIETDEGTRHEYSVPRSVHVNVQEGERVRAGDPLIDGPIDPHDVLAVLGIRELQRYLVDKIQEVYRSQSVAINDKQIEVICRHAAFRASDESRRYGLPRGRAGRSLPLHGRKREGNEPRRRARRRHPTPPRHHQSLALNGQLHLRRLIPGDHQGSHRRGYRRRWSQT